MCISLYGSLDQGTEHYTNVESFSQFQEESFGVIQNCQS